MLEGYISREAALMKLMQDGCSAKNLQSISDVPAADVVPVVRCKDCKHGELYARNDGVTGVYCNCSNSIFQYANEHTFTPVRDKDDFCSYGEAE